MASSATTRRSNGANNENVAVTTTIQQLFPVLGVTRYLCNALRNIITFVVTK